MLYDDIINRIHVNKQMNKQNFIINNVQNFWALF